mmetsp:Transcript_11571/g.23250  ORF Transcript_11571/g.23250 Transcript_11571/m.23250 type:complete len:131 (-) Transcript_11571:67-459(-)|eukprot:CAMPEP_0181296016 /NCGR_PEP_ID=MMETSP1101-20121128/4465_1 /TAXON_ID=46948 /ORGANISM="Rhodomonas abbreviata, Strain Caron Lab Isolate" /LENGTH=130 /DNA_ID=CAMNT_0023400825 /DNA_START=43 /DNA_END=435 /DNA_ORIENTATION=-
MYIYRVHTLAVLSALPTHFLHTKSGTALYKLPPTSWGSPQGRSAEGGHAARREKGRGRWESSRQCCEGVDGGEECEGCGGKGSIGKASDWERRKERTEGEDCEECEEPESEGKGGVGRKEGKGLLKWPPA